MNNYTYQNTNQEPRKTVNEQKNRALRYFKEALINEDYEACTNHVKTARIYGAGPFEIEYLIFDVLGTGKGERKVKTTPRF